MISKLKKCENCKDFKPIWGKKLCKSCYLKKFPPKPIAKISKMGQERKAKKKGKTEKLHIWFIEEIWNKRPHFSEISGKFLGKEPNLCFFHHIFSKSQFPEFEFIAENVILLTADEHQEAELNPTKFEKINKMRKKIANMESYEKDKIEFLGIEITKKDNSKEIFVANPHVKRDIENQLNNNQIPKIIENDLIEEFGELAEEDKLPKEDGIVNIDLLEKEEDLED